MSSPLARAYLELIPSLRGASGHISRDLAGIAPKAGQQLGQDLSRSMSAAFTLQDVGAKMQDLGGRIGNIGSSLTKGITVPIAGAAVAAGGLVATLGWGRLSSIDTAQAQLRGLGYEAEDVDRITDQLTDALSDGMMTMADATFASANAMAAGVEEGAELTHYIQMLDAAAVGGSGTFEEMQRIFSRVAEEGSLTTREFQMMSDRMPGFSAAVADFAGASGDALTEMLHNGEITLDDFLSIMEDHAGDMATEYAQTWEGMVQNTKNWVGIIGQTLLGGAFEQSKESIAEFLDYLSSDEVLEWAEGAAVSIGNAFESILEWVRSAIDWWIELDSETQKFYLTLAGIAVAAGPALLILSKIMTVGGALVSGIGTLIGWLGRAAGAFGLTAGSSGAGGLLRVLGRFTGPVGWVVGGLAAMWTQSEEFRTAVGNLITAVWDLITALWEAVEPLVGPLFEAFGWVMEKAGELAGVLGDVLAWTINNALIPALEGAADAATVMSTVVTDGWAAAAIEHSDIVYEYAKGANQIEEDTRNMGVSVALSLKGMVDDLAQFRDVGWGPTMTGLSIMARGAVTDTAFELGQLPGKLDSATSPLRGIAKRRFGEMALEIGSQVRPLPGRLATSATEMMTRFNDGIRTRLAEVGSNAQEIRERVTIAFQNAPELLTSAGRQIIGGLIKGFSSRIMEVGQWARDILDRAKNPFSNQGSALEGSGSSLVGGFIRGMSSRLGDVTSTASNLVSAARNFFPFSPAKEGPLSGKGYVTYSGQALAEDFSSGIEDRIPDVIAAAEEMTRAAAFLEVPDFLPSSWNAASSHSASRVPAVAGAPASSGSDSRQDQRPVHFTINVSGVDPNEVAWKAADRINEHMRGQGVPVAPIPR